MSSAATQKAIKAAVTGRAFEPVYYLHGDDDYLKEDAIRQLVDAAVAPSFRDFNLENRRAADLDAGTLGSLLGTPPMMADRRVVLIRDVAALKKDARKALDAYLQSPAPDTVLLVTTPAGGKVDKAIGDRATSLVFDPLTGDRVPKWIAYHAEHALNASITPEAIALLQGAVGNDLPTLALELDKCASFTAGKPIDEDAVSAVVGVRKEETLGAFLDAVADRDANEALRLLPGILEQPKVNAVTVVIALSVQVFGLGWAQAMRARGANAGQIAREGFNFLKEAGGVFTGRAWGDAVQSWGRYAGRWTAADIDAALAALLAADHGLKESRLSSDEQMLATVVLSLCGTASGVRGRETGASGTTSGAGGRGTGAASSRRAVSPG